MTSVVSVSTRPSLPVPMTAAGETLLKGFENALQENSSSFSIMAIPAAAAPSAEDRQRMDRRLGAVEAWLAPAPAEIVTRGVGSLQQVLASQAIGEDGRRIARGLYIDALARYPAWAIEQVVQQYANGHLGDRRFMPSPGDMAHEVRKLIEPQVAERARLIRILDAEVITAPADTLSAEQQAELAQRLAEILGRAKPRIPAGEDPRAVAGPAEHGLERLKALGMGGLQLSDAALASRKDRLRQEA